MHLGSILDLMNLQLWYITQCRQLTDHTVFADRSETRCSILAEKPAYLVRVRKARIC